MIYYPVNMLEKAGFTEVIVVVLESAHHQIQHVLQEVCHPRITIDFVTVPNEEDRGTADTLRHLAGLKKIVSDVLVISCDLVTDVPLHQLADMHRTQDASLTMMLVSTSNQNAEKEASSGGKGATKSKTGDRDLIGLDEDSRLLFFAAEADLDESIVLRKSLLTRHPCITIMTRLVDAHLYLISKWVIEYLTDNRMLNSIKGELIPHLIKKQFCSSKAKLQANDGSSGPQRQQRSGSQSDIHSFVSCDPIALVAQELSSSGNTSPKARIRNDIRCYACVVNEGFCVRANTLNAYDEVNRQICRHLPSVLPEWREPAIHPTANIHQRSQVGSDSLVGEGVTIGEKCSIKWSNIGKHCVISDRVKITNSVIMDYVNIKEGCNVQGCIVCSNAHIGEGCVIKGCQVGQGFTVKDRTEAKGEMLLPDEELQL
jgi:translation initiation factor eIF-2B subunit gamma